MTVSTPRPPTNAQQNIVGSGANQQASGPGRGVAEDEDLAGGNAVNPSVAGGANVFLQQVQAIQHLRRRVAQVALFVLTALILAMGVTVWSFTKQIDKATPDVKQLTKENSVVIPPFLEHAKSRG